jgi:uncharacterized membrane protein (DUF373 family)
MRDGVFSAGGRKNMSSSFPGEELIKKFELVAVIAVELLLVVAVAASIAVLYVLFIDGVRTNLVAISSVGEMQSALQRVFAGVLLVMMGLELIETLKTYFAEHHIRIEVILIVAMIAVGRHIVQIDLEHMAGPALLGIAALMVALAVSYFLVRRTHVQPRLPPLENGVDEGQPQT